MRLVWKYILMDARGVRSAVELPRGAVVRSVGGQMDAVCMWVEADPEQPRSVRHFDIYPTGAALPEQPGTYLGVAIVQYGSEAYHVYERTT